MESKRVTNGSFTWRNPLYLGKVRRQAAVLRPIIPGMFVCSKPYSRENLEVCFQPPDDGGREEEQ